MSNIVNLTKCYIETIMTMKSQLILVSVCALMIGIFQDGFIAYGSGVAVIVLVNQVLSYEEISGIDFLVATLPISRKQYVVSRYIGGLIAVIVGLILVTGSYLIVHIVSEREITLPYIYFLMTSIITAILIISVNIPVFLKYGALKSRTILTLVNLAGMFAPILIIQNVDFISNTAIKFISNTLLLWLGIILLGVLLLYISYCVSINLYENKEVKK